MVRGGLFTRYFLEDGIRQLDAYRQVDAGELTAFADFARQRWSGLAGMPHPNEGETESEFIHPMLERLGWQRLPHQEPGKGRRDIADELLFLDEATKNRARPLPSVERFRLGVVVVENEARDTRLDRAGSGGEAPAAQLLRYLSRAETQSDGHCHWGLLTNGRFWRLYWAYAQARVEGFIEFDLPALTDDMPPAVPAGADEHHWLRVFLLLFRRHALAPAGVEGKTFLDIALAEGRHYEQRVTEKLSGAVFDDVFRGLIAALGKGARDSKPADAAWRASIREAALIVLYRLLFLLYAEDRDLLPVRNDAYRAYGLRELRDQAAEIADGHHSVSETRTTWWPRLRDLFVAIAEGDSGMGLPPYNGGLFDDGRLPVLATLSLPDGVLARVIDSLSREEIDGTRRWINYRGLSVQHLGGIYERLLEREVVADEAGALRCAPAFSRGVPAVPTTRRTNWCGSSSAARSARCSKSVARRSASRPRRWRRRDARRRIGSTICASSIRRPRSFRCAFAIRRWGRGISWSRSSITSPIRSAKRSPMRRNWHPGPIRPIARRWSRASRSCAPTFAKPPTRMAGRFRTSNLTTAISSVASF
jgi:hypothetical protein